MRKDLPVEYRLLITFMEEGKPTEYTVECPSEAYARAIARDEVRWESTIRVQCAALGIDEPGDFASFHSK
jgi:hypothetical protein